MNNKENRFFQNADLKIETREDGKKLRITGHAAVFDIPTEIGWWLEEWAPGSFSRTISDGDIRALFNHDPNFPLGRNTNGSLELSEDQKGLYFEVVPPDTQWARDLLISIDRGDITGGSIGFRVKKQKWSEEEVDGKTIVRRRILDADLFDVSPVTFPAFTDTDVSVRSNIERAYAEYQKEKEKSEQDERAKAENEILIKHSLLLKELEIMDREV